ncbi:MAG: hypothetical protein CMP59_07770 [Flavobacteriales bacterium]|nr:hypothetical protein [Flavobacteriales bacterium]|tara:strand:+ start:1215 stop:2744 length:1530 start_codon:yes stop_codon:yes gene_type:complete
MLNLLQKHFGLLILGIAILIGLLSYDQYGIAWDEHSQREIGMVSYEYVFENDTTLLNWKDKDYGVAFELPLIFIEKTLGLDNSRHIYLMRHWVAHLFFLITGYFLFLLIDYLYRNKLLASIGFLLLLLHPRVYAHSFFNSKDIPFMGMFIISLYYMIRALDSKSILRFIGLGICSGILVNLRLMGILLVLAVLVVLSVDLLKSSRKKTELKLMGLYLAFSFLSLYITWPYLWSNPFQNLSTAFENMASFRWNELVLFEGELINATNLPWYYIPKWFIISTPLFYLLFGAFGSILLLLHFIQKPKSFIDNTQKRHNLLFLAFFLVPIIAIIILDSVVYDGWRQLFFIYPPFILLAIYGLSHLQTKTKVYKASLNIVAITIALSGINIIRTFPFQHVYFNELFAFKKEEYLRKHYEMDYWGVSYRQALEYILSEDPQPNIQVAVANEPGKLNLDILPIPDRNRIEIVDFESASYYITNYRWHPQDHSEMKDQHLHSIHLDGNTIVSIFKLK